MSQENHHIILTAQGSDSLNLLSLIASTCAKYECHILESKVINFGEDAAVMMLIRGSWHAIAKLESNFASIEKKTNFLLHCKRSQYTASNTTGLPYQAQLITSDRSGILAKLCDFFIKNKISIDECHIETFQPTRSSTKMCQLNINIRIPTQAHIATIRDGFIAYCEELNLDALLEPLK